LKILTTIAEVKGSEQTGGALVPTLGALHAGHVSLIKAAKSSGLPTIVSIFVNPTQFGPDEDYDRYPRSFDSDCEKAADAGADAVFAPAVEEMYKSSTSRIEVPEVTELYEGSLRPAHFSGVCTVVLKLINIAECQEAFFGQKDLQQCAVIQRMAADLNVPVEIRIVPTLREPDGLAMSSRNVYLDPKSRAIAPSLYRTLSDTRQRLLMGEDPATEVATAATNLEREGFRVDYVDLIDRVAFRPTTLIHKNCALIAAAKLGNTRLIDNLLVFSDENMS
jgi:pantoate--beta-alanine ligase